MKIKCKLCEDIVDGGNKGTLIKCKCGACGIDETKWYCRVLGNPKNYVKIDEMEFK